MKEVTFSHFISNRIKFDGQWFPMKWFDVRFLDIVKLTRYARSYKDQNVDALIMITCRS